VASWRNWAGSVRVSPRQLLKPESVSEIQEIVRGMPRGGRIRMTGSGHSFTPIAVSRDVLMRPSHFGEGVGIDSDRRVARVPAGMTLSDVNDHLAAAGFALANMGDITAQTMAGSISTSTHGTGLGFTGLAGQVVGFGLVSANGDHMECSETEHPEVLRFGRVGLGALGILTYVDMRIVPAFRLHAVEEPRRLSEVLSNFDRTVSSVDHFEFYWIPHTRWALTKRNNRTSEPARPMGAAREWWQKSFLENTAFGALCAVGRTMPSLIPRLATALPSSGEVSYSNASHRVFATQRRVRFVEMEYAIPRAACSEALERVTRLVDDRGFRVSFPVEVRFTAADDVILSTSTGRASCYIAVHMYRGTEYETYFREVGRIMADYGGRPHWGKMHYLGAAELSALYPEWETFLGVRSKFDPEGVFVNEYVRRIFGLTD